jgi:hypothetical protein
MGVREDCELRDGASPPTLERSAISAQLGGSSVDGRAILVAPEWVVMGWLAVRAVLLSARQRRGVSWELCPVT